MKKIIITLIIVVLLSLLTGCQNGKNPPIIINNKTENKEKDINYKIEKIVLSKGYQSIEPNVEIVQKGNKSKLLATLGLIECSGIIVDKITTTNNEVNIYVNKLNENETQLAIPQVLIELKDSDMKKLENFKFNIVNQNYEPIMLKFNKNEILNNIYSHFKIIQNTIPEVDLIQSNDKLIWDINFHGIFDKESSNNPLINLSVKVDANTGEILTSDKKTISNYIDNGIVLDFVPKKYLLYKKGENQDKYNILWLYNLETGKKKKLYTSDKTIYSAKFNPDYSTIAMIEHDDEITNLKLITINNKKAKDITPDKLQHIWLVNWQDNSSLYFVNNDTKHDSTIQKYDLKNDSLETMLHINKNILNFDIKDDTFLLTEFDEKKVNQNIFLVRDGEIIKEIDKGFNASFFGDDKIIYLKNTKNNDINTFNIYNLEKDTKDIKKECNVQNYLLIDDKNLVIISKNSCNDNYTLCKYNTNTCILTPFANITGDKFFYDIDNNIGYITLNPSIEESNKNIIYSVNLDNLKLNK